MRKLDWVALLLIVVVAIGGKILGGDESVPENYSSRRPNPELFEPKTWDAETRAWLQGRAQEKRPVTGSSFPNSERRSDRRDRSQGIVDGVGFFRIVRRILADCPSRRRGVRSSLHTDRNTGGSPGGPHRHPSPSRRCPLNHRRRSRGASRCGLPHGET